MSVGARQMLKLMGALSSVPIASGMPVSRLHTRLRTPRVPADSARSLSSASMGATGPRRGMLLTWSRSTTWSKPSSRPSTGARSPRQVNRI